MEHKGIADTYINEGMDENRLHGVIEGDVVGRRSGQTFATIMLMLGEVQLGGPWNVYCYVGETKTFAQKVKKEFQEILQHEDYQTNSISPDTLEVVNNTNCVQRFYFWSASLPSLTVGAKGRIFARVFVDVTPETGREYAEEIESLKLKEV